MSSQPSTRMTARRHPPEVRRALIVAAAQELIVENGLPGTSARVIAARCGISLGTLTYHFASIDDLLAEALREASERLTSEISAAVAEVDGSANKLRRIVDDALPISESARRNWRLWLECWARAPHSSDLAALHTERYDAWRGLVLTIVLEGIERQEFRPADARAVAVQFVALQDGLGLQAAIGDAAVPVEAARGILYAMIDQLVVETV